MLTVKLTYNQFLSVIEVKAVKFRFPKAPIWFSRLIQFAAMLIAEYSPWHTAFQSAKLFQIGKLDNLHKVSHESLSQDPE